MASVATNASFCGVPGCVKLPSSVNDISINSTIVDWFPDVPSMVGASVTLSSLPIAVGNNDVSFPILSTIVGTALGAMDVVGINVTSPPPPPPVGLPLCKMSGSILGAILGCSGSITADVGNSEGAPESSTPPVVGANDMDGDEDSLSPPAVVGNDDGISDDDGASVLLPVGAGAGVGLGCIVGRRTGGDVGWSKIFRSIGSSSCRSSAAVFVSNVVRVSYDLHRPRCLVADVVAGSGLLN